MYFILLYTARESLLIAVNTIYTYVYIHKYMYDRTASSQSVCREKKRESGVKLFLLL
jgi:hypothetical protein